jgi:hypothetical protein
MKGNKNMTSVTTSTRRNERGNALFLILIAVALFAALSYAVTQSGRGSGTIDKEQGLISASQITQFPAAVRTGVTRMVITGTAAGALTFSPSDTTSVGVFSASGGGVVSQKPPTAGVTSTAWRFKTAPTDDTGWFISGIGTDTASGKDIFALLDNVSIGVCNNINRGLGLTNSSPRNEATVVTLTSTNEGTPTQTGGGANTDVGTAAATFTWYAHALATDVQPFACVQNGVSTYMYYHALVER